MTVTLTESEVEEQYQEYLQEAYGDIEICGYTYDAATALQRVDPIAYRVGLSDYESMIDEE